MVFQDLLTNKDDYLRASRALLREIIKQTKHEINFQAFCLGLMQERKEPQYLEMEFKVPWDSCLPLSPCSFLTRRGFLCSRDGQCEQCEATQRCPILHKDGAGLTKLGSLTLQLAGLRSNLGDGQSTPVKGLIDSGCRARYGREFC